MLPDWVPEHGDAGAEAGATSYVDPVEALFRAEMRQEQQQSKRKRGLGERGAFTPNRHMAQAIDNALRGCLQLSLAYFAPSQRRPQALAEGEERYLRTLPQALQVEGTAARRSCIRNTNTNENWEEVPRDVRDGVLHRPVLHMSLDEGSVGLYMAHWLLYEGVRATMTEDLPCQGWAPPAAAQAGAS